MVSISKKRINVDLFQIALLLTLLHSGTYYPEDILSLDSDIPGYLNNVDTNNTRPLSEFNVTEDYGHAYYSRMSTYHRRSGEYNGTAPYLSMKGLNEPANDSIGIEVSNEFMPDENYFRERIVEELRRLSIQRYSQLPRGPSKATLAFQNVTAYLLSSANGSQPSGFDTAPDLHGTPLDAADSSFIPLSVIEDTDQDEGLLGTAQHTTDSGLDSSLFMDFETSSISLDAKHNGNDDLLREPTAVSGFPLLEDLPSPLDLEPVSFDFDSSPLLPGEKPDPTQSLPPVESEFFFNDNAEGAAALPTHWAGFEDLWDFDLGAPTAPEIDFGQTSSDLTSDNLNIFNGFDDISDEELMRTISPLAIHRGEGSETENPSTSVAGSVSKEEFDTRRRVVSSCGESISSHDEPATNDEDDEANNSDVGSLLGEIWETDSGIFDLLVESPASANNDQKEETTRQRPFTSETSEEHLDLGDIKLDGDSDEHSQDVDDSSDEMIQTAPMHGTVRPTSHLAQPRGFQVHARMPGLLHHRGGSMAQGWQELASLLNMPSHHGDPNGGPLPPPLPHHFGHHHHHHHLHHHPSSLHHPHHPMHHHSPFSTAPPAAPYNTDSARSVLLQNATIPPPELNSTGPYPNLGMGPPPNLGSAVTSSMHLTNNSDPMSDPSAHYNKMIENSHDMLYYTNSTSNPTTEMSNQTTEGFLSSILNDDDLQLMDMAMNEGMYTMRMLDNSAAQNGSVGQANLPHEASLSIGAQGINSTSEDRMEASSDSAVSSMGSERVPPMTEPHMSDNEWSESEHHSHASPYSLDYSSGKLRGYSDYYGKESGHRVNTPVAQKKHQMFGKRFQQEQGSMPLHPYSLSAHPPGALPLPYPSTSGLHHPSNGSMEPLEMKYSCSIDFARHDGRLGATGPSDLVHSNHTYAHPPTHPDAMMAARSSRPPKERHSKSVKEFKSDEHLSRDEKRARSMNLPMTTDDIINLPMDEFNERLSKYDLTESQLSLIRDIRRRGKNKVAAQNCRKRKLDQIIQLADEVGQIRERKNGLMREQESLAARRNILKDKYAQLYRHVFQALRDTDGNPYSPYEFSLQQAADGNIILVPRNSASGSSNSDSLDSSSSRRHKSKDDSKKDGSA